MSLEEIRLEHVPDTHKVYTGLFRDVANAGYLQSQLLARNSDFEYAFIDASSILSRVQLLAAVYKALTVLLDGTLKTPNVHSEVVCALSASNNVRLLRLPLVCPLPPSTRLATPTSCLPDPDQTNHHLSRVEQISEAYRRWGITEATKNIVIVKIVFPTESQPQAPSAQEVNAHLAQVVEGTPARLTDAELAGLTDWPKVRKYYKLNNAPTLEGKDEAGKVKEMGVLALGGMALRGL
jgi:EKC/KEOPS complex subunit CGI121/TPRKB